MWIFQSNCDVYDSNSLICYISPHFFFFKWSNHKVRRKHKCVYGVIKNVVRIFHLILQISTNEVNSVASGLNRSVASEVGYRNVTFHRMIFFFPLASSHGYVKICKIRSF